MKINCKKCGSIFEGNISRKNGKWYSLCPNCGRLTQAAVPKGRIVMAFVDDTDPSRDMELFTDDFRGKEIRSYYAFDDPKDFINTWAQLVDTGNDSMWYWCRDRGRIFCSGACDPDDLYFFYEHFKIKDRGNVLMRIYSEKEWEKAQYTNRWGDNPYNRSRVEVGEVPAAYIGRRTVMVGGMNGCELLTEGFHFLINDEEGRSGKFYITHKKKGVSKRKYGIYHGFIVEAADSNVASEYFRLTHPDSEGVVVRALRGGDMKPGIPFKVVPEGRWKGAGMGDYRCSLCDTETAGTPEFCPECHAYML